MILKKSFILLLFVMIHPLLSGENILLKDGRIIKGNIINIQINSVSIVSDQVRYDIMMKQVEYIIAEVKQSQFTELKIVQENNSINYIKLIKMTETALYYKNINETDLKVIKLNYIKSIALSKKPDLTYTKTSSLESEVNHYQDYNEDLKNLYAKISGKSFNETSYQLIIENPDFYEIFWTIFSEYLNTQYQNILWKLIENYSEKERSLKIIYSENETGNMNNKKDIIQLRIDFYKRAKKMIISSKGE